MPYPDQKELLCDLVVNDHVALDDEPLLLAVYYASETAPDDECLFEIAHNFGYGESSEDGHIFQIQFGPAPNFPLPDGGRLRLFLTNPVEFKQGITEGWPEIKDLQTAIRDGQYTQLYHRLEDYEADEMLALLKLDLVVV